MIAELQIIAERNILGKDFRAFNQPENPLFLAKEVAEWIEYDPSSVHKMLATIDAEEKVRKIVPTLGGPQESWFVTEDGLYEVLFQSRKPLAKAFKREVKKVLKEIRLGRFARMSGDQKTIRVENRTIQIPTGSSVSSVSISKHGAVTVKFQNGTESASKPTKRSPGRPAKEKPVPAIAAPEVTADPVKAAVQEFLGQRCSIDPRHCTASENIWIAWQNWSLDHDTGFHVGKAAFFRQLNELSASN